MRLSEFWDLCPAELDQIVSAWNWNFERRRDLALASGWAAFLCDRAYPTGPVPSLQEFIDWATGRSVPDAPPTQEELRRKFNWLHSLLQVPQ